MRRRFSLLTLLIVLSSMVWISPVYAGTVLKVRAINPLDKETVSSIRYPLPINVTPDDIIGQRILYSIQKTEDQGIDLNFVFNEKDELYYIEQEIKFAAKEIIVLEVDIEDIWIVDSDIIDALRDSANSLFNGAGDEEETTSPETARLLKEEILKGLDEIVARQNKGSIAEVGVKKHIEIYEKNMDALRQTEIDLEMLETLMTTQ